MAEIPKNILKFDDLAEEDSEDSAVETPVRASRLARLRNAMRSADSQAWEIYGKRAVRAGRTSKRMAKVALDKLSQLKPEATTQNEQGPVEPTATEYHPALQPIAEGNYLANKELFPQLLVQMKSEGREDFVGLTWSRYGTKRQIIEDKIIHTTQHGEPREDRILVEETYNSKGQPTGVVSHTYAGFDKYLHNTWLLPAETAASILTNPLMDPTKANETLAQRIYGVHWEEPGPRAEI